MKTITKLISALGAYDDANSINLMRILINSRQLQRTEIINRIGKYKKHAEIDFKTYYGGNLSALFSELYFGYESINKVNCYSQDILTRSFVHGLRKPEIRRIILN